MEQIPNAVLIISGVGILFVILMIPEMMMAVMLVVMIGTMIMPYTLAVNVRKIDGSCSHVTLTSFGGLLTHVDADLCGEELRKFTKEHRK